MFSRRALRISGAAVWLAGMSACSSATAADGGSGRSILFIGNSLTYANDLPSMVAKVGEAARSPVRVAMAAGPNLAVIDHTNGATDAVAQIDRGGWAYVVLQQGPTPAGMCRDTLVIAAMRLAPHIRGAGGRPVLFLPWVRQGHPESLDWARETARLAARAVGGVVAPIGIAWKDALDADPSAPLYGPDGYHPAPAGTLLAALTVYDRLFGMDVRTIATEPLATLPGVGLSPAQIRALAAAAHSASESQPVDSAIPAPADTTVVSSEGGPC